MHALAHQFPERRINFALPLDPAETAEGGALDRQREMTFSAGIMAGMTDMLTALVFKRESCRVECGIQALDHLSCDWSGSSVGHGSYIVGLNRRGTSGH